MKTRVLKSYPYPLAGFPVVLEKVKVAVTGEGEFPLLDHEEVQRRILLALAAKPTRLTGNQVRYIRHAFELSLRGFAKLFHFSAPSVHQWEKRGNRSTGMEWPSELLLRTHVLLRYADDKAVLDNWRALEHVEMQDEAADTVISIDPNVSRSSDEPAGEIVWSKQTSCRNSVAVDRQHRRKNTAVGNQTSSKPNAREMEMINAFADAA